MRKIRNNTKIEAKKSLGQNFLRDPKILKKIVDFAKIEKEDTVLEVGPGEGALTKFLLERATRVVAIEKDGLLAEKLKEKFESEIKSEKLEVVVGDILNYDLLPTNYKLIGNIPYYITGAIFKKFLESENKPFDSAQGKPKSICFVVQKEVAERIMARDEKESILSISIKIFGKPEFGGVIKAGSFFPKPKVDSAIIAIRGITPITPPNPPLGKGREDQRDFEKRFFEILKAGFAHKRKFLIKNLVSSKLSRPGINSLMEIFKKCGIPEKARAEDLKVDDWLCLAREL
ncbi:MAG TPA: 16S rRNA (adenine(1518)-N(6)/adenine(1519)-N(6))-dimethyltransferase RsmA [Candidatus Paceibacterota bacterium]